MTRIICTTVFLCCAAPWSLIADSITLGTDNGGNADPFAGAFSGFPGTEYQEAYAGSDFSGPISITSITFFLEPGYSGTTLTSATYQVSLSTIATNIDDLSDTDLESNIGEKDAIFSTVTLAGTAPAELTFTGGPFHYDPSLGNLLLDIRISDVTNSGSAAFEDGNGDGPPGIVRYSNLYNGTTGYGMVTECDDSASNNLSNLDIPEPSTLILLACGLAGFFVRRFGERRHGAG
jgi:hypothetical protein